MNGPVRKRRDRFIARAIAQCATASEFSETRCLRIFSAHNKEHRATDDGHAVAQIPRFILRAVRNEAIEKH